MENMAGYCLRNGLSKPLTCFILDLIEGIESNGGTFLLGEDDCIRESNVLLSLVSWSYQVDRYSGHILFWVCDHSPPLRLRVMKPTGHTLRSQT